MLLRNKSSKVATYLNFTRKHFKSNSILFVYFLQNYSSRFHKESFITFMISNLHRGRVQSSAQNVTKTLQFVLIIWQISFDPWALITFLIFCERALRYRSSTFNKSKLLNKLQEQQAPIVNSLLKVFLKFLQHLQRRKHLKTPPLKSLRLQKLLFSVNYS